MNRIKYSLILALALSLAACGVRRDLKMPETEQQPVQQNEKVQP